MSSLQNLLTELNSKKGLKVFSFATITLVLESLVDISKQIVKLSPDLLNVVAQVLASATDLLSVSLDMLIFGADIADALIYVVPAASIIFVAAKISQVV